MKHTKKNIAIIGDGAWGTTLALVLNEKEYPVTIWGAFPEYVKEVEQARVNRKFLSGITIPSAINFSTDLDTAVAQADIIVLAVPSQFLGGVLKKIKKTDYAKKPFVSVTKGIDLKTFDTMSDLVIKELGKVPLAVLSGPTIAIEVARKIPTTAVIASKNARLADELQAIFSCDYFRLYTNNDVLGVEICGSIKNVIALACGVCDGLGLGTNTKAALLTRGLAEITRLGKALKAKPETFAGLAGLGDLATTCFSLNSRNRTVGEALGRGKTIDDILGSMDSVAEGVPTAKAVHRLAKKLKIDMPITEAVYSIIYQKKSASAVVGHLMRRSLKRE
jgi:glycerol-3-phosphate dehydrogenase (NAD(P)+)